MSEKVTCGGYIYKWGTKVGCTEYTIPEDVFKKGASEDFTYPVTDGTFLYNDSTKKRFQSVKRYWQMQAEVR